MPAIGVWRLPPAEQISRLTGALIHASGFCALYIRYNYFGHTVKLTCS
jgi:hypothetical protein